jgi:Tfp pilus assembly protein PilV
MVHDSRRGMSIFEIVLAAAILAVAAAGFVGAYALSVQSRKSAADRVHASFLAEEGLEAARAMRDGSFSNLVNGTWGLATTSNQWNLLGPQDVTAGFTRQITIADADSSTKQVTAAVSWRSPGSTTSTVSLATYLANLAIPQAYHLTINIASAVIGGTGSKELQGITLGNTGPSPITIAQITASWTNSRLLQQIQINGAVAWSGSQSSGATLTLATTTLAAGATAIPINRFLFSGSMKSNTFTIIFIMGDGSTGTTTLSL